MNELLRAITKLSDSNTSFPQTSLESYVSESFQSNDANQIWHLFYLIKVRVRQVSVFYENQVYSGSIHQISKTTATLSLPSFEKGAGKYLGIEFLYANFIYKFEVKILSNDKDNVEVELPQCLQTKTLRKGGRVEIDDLFLSFTLNYPPFPQTPFMGIPATEYRLKTQYAPLIWELEKEDPSLTLIYKIICKECCKDGLKFDVVFYKSSKPEKPGSIEESMRSIYDTIYIADSRILESYYQDNNLPGLINLSKDYQKLSKQSLEKAQVYCKKIQSEDLSASLASYALSPLFIFDKPVGYIKLSASILSNRANVRSEDAQQFNFFAKCLSYALSKAIITRNYFHQIRTPIINLSYSGALIQVNDEEIRDYLLLQSYLKIKMEINNTVLYLKARVLSYLSLKEGGSGLQLQFYYLSPDAATLLENLVYERNTAILEANMVL